MQDSYFNNGATTLSITTISIRTRSITMKICWAYQHSASSVIMINIVILSDIVLSFFVWVSLWWVQYPECCYTGRYCADCHCSHADRLGILTMPELFFTVYSFWVISFNCKWLGNCDIWQSLPKLYNYWIKRYHLRAVINIYKFYDRRIS